VLNLLKQTVRYFKNFDSKLDPVGILLASTASFICLLLLWDNGFYITDSVGYYKSAWWFSEIVKIKLAVLLGSDNINMFDPIYNESYLKLFSSPGNYVTYVGYVFAKRGGYYFSLCFANRNCKNVLFSANGSTQIGSDPYVLIDGLFCVSNWGAGI